MAPRLICALAALASAYDWTTPDAGLTPFNCTAFPNPIQVLLPDGQSAPYNVSELDLATGRYTLFFSLKWVAQSAQTSNNDGSACPGIAAPVFPSMAPTITETPTQQPTIGFWSNPEKPFDCINHPNPIQVYGPQKPPPPFNTEELDLGTGDYTAIADFSPVPPTTPPTRRRS